MSEARYRVVLTSQSALRVGKRRGWKTPRFHLRIRDDMEGNSKDEPPVHGGLIYTIELDAETITQALDEAVAITRHIADQMSFVHRVGIGHPRPRFAVDIDPSHPNRELAQVLDAPQLHQPRRVYEELLYKQVFSAIDRLRQQSPRDALRIDRAFHYLRNSYLEDDPIDRFEDAWTALEALNRLIQWKHDQPTTYQRKCKCGQDLICSNCQRQFLVPDNASGIDYVITDLLQESEEKAKNLRQRRNAIVHAYSPLAEILDGIVEFTRLAQQAVVAGVLDILGLSEEQVPGAQREVLAVAESSRLLVVADLYDLSIEDLEGQREYPQLFLQGIEVEITATPQASAGEARPMGAQVYVGIKHYNGEWDIKEVCWWLVLDPEQSETLPSLMPKKWIPSL